MGKKMFTVTILVFLLSLVASSLAHAEDSSCYWECTSSKGCIIKDKCTVDMTPSNGNVKMNKAPSGGYRFDTGTRLRTNPPSALKKANGWVRRCD